MNRPVEDSVMRDLQLKLASDVLNAISRTIQLTNYNIDDTAELVRVAASTCLIATTFLAKLKFKISDEIAQRQLIAALPIIMNSLQNTPQIRELLDEAMSHVRF